MKKTLLLFALLVVAGWSPVAEGVPDELDRRVAVVQNYLGPGYLAFSTDFASGKMQMSASSDGVSWGDWVAVNTTITVTSNPVGCSSNSTGARIFAQGTDGQVYMYAQTGSTEFTETKLSTGIPADLKPAQFSVDPVRCVFLRNATHIFARSQSAASSRVYWSYLNGNATSGSKWVAIGDGGKHLTYDPYVAVNAFVDRLEVFGVFQDGKLLHTWQTSLTSFEDDWHELCLFPPKFTSSPVVHSMGKSFFNGMLEVFARGDDGVVHHIWQTTCDKVKNPWGPCTWALTYHKLGGEPPASKSSRNPFTISRNIHLGIELFTIGSADQHLYHIWQSERDSSWSDWEDLGALSSSSGFESQPAILLDRSGWWQAFALTSVGKVGQFVQSPLKFSLSTNQVAFNRNVTVTWAIPKDEATHKDWIGVYPSGAASHLYVDYSYVGGEQNPLKDPVPQGSLNFTAVLPNGKYDYRYMVNKAYDTVLQASLTIYNATKDPEWMQLYRGIARGLGSIDGNITLCVKDGNRTVETFRAAFAAFENRQIIEGLHLIAEGLEDFRDVLIQCNETKIVEDLTKFIEDLISCTEDACLKFAIDAGVEIVILFENRYEIYGDIRGAKNCFGFKAYEQGGISIGRVTDACMTLR